MRPTILSLGLIALLGLPAAFALAQEPVHAAPAASTTAAPAQRYATDATLRQQMREIHGVVQALGHFEHDHITPELAARLSDQVTGHVNTIIVNCKLPPDADEALHHIIGPLLQDASALKADPRRLDAIAGMRKALDQYARQFDDPGFPASPAN
jgi:hypothetical protein